MGRTPIPRVPPPVRPPDRESFHLGRARDAYLLNEITLERFEELASCVLRGGYLTERLEPIQASVGE